MLKLLALPSEFIENALAWHGAILSLRDFDLVDLPSSKLAVLLNTKDEIFREASEAGELNMNADDFLPVMTYVIVKSNLRHPWASALYLRRLLGDDFVSGEGAYYLTTFEIALNHIMSMEIPSI